MYGVASDSPVSNSAALYGKSVTSDSELRLLISEFVGQPNCKHMSELTVIPMSSGANGHLSRATLIRRLLARRPPATVYFSSI